MVLECQVVQEELYKRLEGHWVQVSRDQVGNSMLNHSRQNPCKSCLDRSILSLGPSKRDELNAMTNKCRNR